MTLNMPDIRPQHIMQIRDDYAVSRIAFGGAFQQIISKGTKIAPVRYEVSWRHLSQADKEILVAFFEARQGLMPFAFTPEDGGGDVEVICHNWHITSAGAGTWHMTASLSAH